MHGGDDAVERWIEEAADLQRRLEEVRRRLVERGVEGRPGGADFDVLMCEAEGRVVALGLAGVREVVPMARLGPLPEAPGWMLGLLNLRGHPVPVIDLTARLGGALRPPEVSDLIVVLEIPTGAVGLRVEQVHGVRRVRTADLGPRPPELPGAEYVVGTCEIDGRSAFLVGLGAFASPGGRGSGG